MDVDKKLFEPYIRMAKFIARVCGPRCETLVHDLSDLDHTIIFIENNHVTGRQVGGKITDFGLKLLLDEKWRNLDYVVNYEGVSLIGNKPLRTSTFYVRDEREKIVGLLVVNIDISDYYAMKALVDFELTVEDNLSNTFENKVTEHFLFSSAEVMETIFENAVRETGYSSLEGLGADDKKKIMAKLYQMNYYNLKGAVNESAKKLGISSPTAYRYLREIQG
ncbi:PAS domain-containing protein [Clostridia bacterium OttesenSCG-928-O13]|nr:PAS domain-containing protein [Clostridia bacterium OttesenSCG-928-O13]